MLKKKIMNHGNIVRMVSNNLYDIYLLIEPKIYMCHHAFRRMLENLKAIGNIENIADIVICLIVDRYSGVPRTSVSANSCESLYFGII